MRRRARREPAPGSVAAVLAGYERDAAAAGDAVRLAAVRSWIHMLWAARGDPEAGELLLAFAREDG